MRRVAFAFACVFAIGIGALPAYAAQSVLPPIEQKERLEDLNDLPLPGADLKSLPPGNAETAVDPKAVFRNGCVFFPGGRVSFPVSIPPRRTTFYAVRPNRFFDVVMTVRVPATGRFFVRDRFFAGGTERLSLFNPNFFRINTRVTISGFRGSTGCFFFSARP